MYSRKNRDRRDGIRTAEPREQELARATIPAAVEDYLEWLRGYFARGGTPTHFYDYPFHRKRWELAVGEAIVDGTREYGANSRRIIVGKYGKLALKPGDAFGGWAHTNIYVLSDFSTPQAHPWVPVYSDPEFDAILTAEHQQQRAAQRAEDKRFMRQTR